MLLLLLRRSLLLLLLLPDQQRLTAAQAHVQPKNGGPPDPAGSGRLQFCQWPCKCRPNRPPCPPGVSSVLDGCGCCKSCARQAGQACNERDVCDPHKGLYCDFSGDGPRFQLGRCAYMMAVGCDLNGVHYDNGQAFTPSALYKCTCIAGAIGCTPAFVHKPAGLQGPVPAGLMGNTPAGLQQAGSKKHQQDTGYLSAHRAPPVAWKRNCLVQSTPWSPCSRTCGIGISMRVNNDNSKCEMRKDRRLCLLRPCDKSIMKSVKVPKGKTCRPQFQAQKAEKLRLSGCTSTKRFRPTYCGICSDRRCCIPNKSRMIRVDFRCQGGTSTTWRMQWVTSCVCTSKCSEPGDMFSELRLL